MNAGVRGMVDADVKWGGEKVGAWWGRGGLGLVVDARVGWGVHGQQMHRCAGVDAIVHRTHGHGLGCAQDPPAWAPECGVPSSRFFNSPFGVRLCEEGTRTQD